MINFSHHSHSGRRLPHEHTSYAGLAFIVLVAGLVLGLATTSTTASPPQSQNIDVNAAVATTQAPIITAPADGQYFTNVPVTINGTCLPDFVVGVLRNDVLAGSTPCTPNGQFSLQIDLLTGSNAVAARHYRPGPVSPKSNQVTLVYEKPAPAQPPAVPTPADRTLPRSVQNNPAGGELEPSQKPEQLVLSSQEAYQTITAGQKLKWTVDVSGGRLPYAINWDWGDGHSDLVSLSSAGPYSATHIYATAGTYQIKIKATDIEGNAAYLQLVAVASGGAHPAAAGAAGLPPVMLWPIYVTLLAVLLSFWLGERYELWYIRRHLSSRGL